MSFHYSRNDYTAAEEIQFHKEQRKKQIIALMRTGQFVDPEERRELFGDPHPHRKLPFGKGPVIPGLPGLARKVARDRLDVPIPAFQIPRIEL
jgi:hypothetical protein